MSIEVLKERARRHEQREEWQSALDLYRQAIDQESMEEQLDIGLWNRVGDLQTRLGNLGAAVEAYEQAVDLYVDSGLANNAIAVCKKIVRHVPLRNEVYLKMGKIRIDQGFLVDARQNFLTYAERMLAQGELDEAFRALIEFADLAPEDTDIRLAIAGQLEQHGREEEALEQLTVAYIPLRDSGAPEAEAFGDRILQLSPEVDLASITVATAKEEWQPPEQLFQDEGEPAATEHVEDTPVEVAPMGGFESTSLMEDTEADAAATPDDHVADALEDQTSESSGADLAAAADSEADVGPSVTEDPFEAPEAPSLPGFAVQSPVWGEPEAEVEEFAPPPLPLLGQDSPALEDADLSLDEVSSGLRDVFAEDGGGDAADDPIPAIEEPIASWTPSESVESAVEDSRLELSGSEDVGEDDLEPTLDDDTFLDAVGLDQPTEEAPSGDGSSWLQSVEEGAEEEGLDGSFAGAVQEADEGQEIDPAFTGIESNDLDEPAVALTEAPSDFESEGGSGDGLAPMQLEEAQESEGSGSGTGFDDAMARTRALIEQVPDDVSHRQRLVDLALHVDDTVVLIDAYLGLAGCLERTGEGPRSRAIYQQVLNLDAGNVEATVALSRSAIVSAALPEAPAPAAPVAPAPPKREEYIDLGAMILEDDEEEEKSTRFVVAFEEPTGDEEADFARMLRQFKQKVSENVAADDVKAHHDLGTAYKEMGLLDEAIEEYQSALRASGSHLPTYELLGQCFIELGKHEAAVSTLSRALDAPHSVEDELIGILYYLARAHEQVGNSSAAVEFYDRVFALDINFADVTERLRALR